MSAAGPDAAATGMHTAGCVPARRHTRPHANGLEIDARQLGAAPEAASGGRAHVRPAQNAAQAILLRHARMQGLHGEDAEIFRAPAGPGGKDAQLS